MKLLIGAVLVFFLLFGCTQTNEGTGLIGIGETMEKQPIVEAGDTIQVEYVGTLQTGEQFDSSEGKPPLEFTAGEGQMIKGFDEAVIGMQLSSEKIISIPPNEAYGEKDEKLIIPIPLTEIREAGIEPIIGMELYANGRPIEIIEINDENALVDYNHKLSGQTLNFWLKIVSITKPETQ